MYRAGVWRFGLRFERVSAFAFFSSNLQSNSSRGFFQTLKKPRFLGSPKCPNCFSHFFWGGCLLPETYARIQLLCIMGLSVQGWGLRLGLWILVLVPQLKPSNLSLLFHCLVFYSVLVT